MRVRDGFGKIRTFWDKGGANHVHARLRRRNSLFFAGNLHIGKLAFAFGIRQAFDGPYSHRLRAHHLFAAVFDFCISCHRAIVK